MASTTINIRREVLSKITNAAIQSNKSRREIIIYLLKLVARNNDSHLRGFGTVKYQSDDDPDNWHCFHIRFKPDEYEYFLDLRKVCKCSVSHLVAIAADKYLNDIMANVDNYALFSNYVLRREIIDGIICWHLYWGYPEKHLNSLRL